MCESGNVTIVHDHGHENEKKNEKTCDNVKGANVFSKTENFTFMDPSCSQVKLSN